MSIAPSNVSQRSQDAATDQRCTKGDIARECRRLACGVSGILLVVLPALSSSNVVAQELYFAEGYTTSRPSDQFAGIATTFAGVNQQVLETVLCERPGVSIAPGERLGTLALHFAAAAGLSVVPDILTMDDLRAYEDFARDVCEPDTEVERTPFNIVYSTCRMTMRAASETLPVAQTLDVRFPPGQTDGVMEIIDHEAETALVTDLLLAQSLGEDGGLLSLGSEGDGDNVTRRDSSDFDEVLSETLHAVTYELSFKLDFLASAAGASGEPGSGGFAGLMSAMSPTIATQGLAWVSPEAPGVDTVRGFYEQFAAALRSSSSSQSLLGGLFNHQVLSEGLPVAMDETTEIRTPYGVQQRTRSTSRILRHYTRPEPEGYCEGSYIPENYTISNPMADAAAAISDTTAQTSAGAGAATDATSQGMNELAEAMSGLSDEQRSALEGLGMGGLFGGGGATGGAGSQRQPGQASTPAAAAPAVGGRPSSDDLYSDNLTQMVQRHLEALGYDPGNTDGEPGLQTTIAISQFQAERGLEVTGEVSPQLAGVLSAELDRQR